MQSEQFSLEVGHLAPKSPEIFEQLASGHVFAFIFHEPGFFEQKKTAWHPPHRKENHPPTTGPDFICKKITPRALGDGHCYTPPLRGYFFRRRGLKMATFTRKWAWSAGTGAHRPPRGIRQGQESILVQLPRSPIQRPLVSEMISEELCRLGVCRTTHQPCMGDGWRPATQKRFSESGGRALFLGFTSGPWGCDTDLGTAHHSGTTR